jgi:HEAT repeat protein
MQVRVWLMAALTLLSVASMPSDGSARQTADVEKYCAMLHSLDDAERETARAELVKIGRPAVWAVIAVLGRDQVYLGREGAAVVLGRIRDERAVKPLIAALKDDYAAVREQASSALVLIGGTKTVDAVLEALARGGSDPFLEAAASTLGLLGDKRALPALEKLEKHASQDVAKAATEAVARLRSPKASSK